MQLSDAEMDAAALRMYRHFLLQAKNEIEESKFDCDQIVTIFRKLRTESETSQVLVSASYVEDRIATLLAHRLMHLDTPADRERVFGSNGPLATFGARLTMAYHFGWLTKQTYQDVTSFRKIRNEFAHRAFEAKFSDPKLESLFYPLFERLGRFDQSGVVAAMDADKNDVLRRLHQIESSERYLASIAVLIGDVFRELLVMPVALRHNVDPWDLCAPGDYQPEVVSRLLKNSVRSALEIFARR